jgi:hypothetical protein
MSTSLQTHTETPPVAVPPAKAPAVRNDAESMWKFVCEQAEKLAAAPLTPVHLKVRKSDLTNVPEEKRGHIAWQQTVANCILVANQAVRWGADIFAVAAETYVVGNKLGYQGKLIAAIVNTRAGLSKPLSIMYGPGKGDDLAAVVFAKREGDVSDDAYELLEAYTDQEDRVAARKLLRMGVEAVRLTVAQAKTKNDMWWKDPEQKLWYTGCTKWARRYTPELMLGILSNDDLDLMREREMGLSQESQSRIDVVLPATLDASGVLSTMPDNYDAEVKRLPQPKEEQPQAPAGPVEVIEPAVQSQPPEPPKTETVTVPAEHVELPPTAAEKAAKAAPRKATKPTQQAATAPAAQKPAPATKPAPAAPSATQKPAQTAPTSTPPAKAQPAQPQRSEAWMKAHSIMRGMKHKGDGKAAWEAIQKLLTDQQELDDMLHLVEQRLAELPASPTDRPAMAPKPTNGGGKLFT